MLRFLRSPRPSKVDDATLLARFQQSGQAEDLTPLFERHLELIYGQCLHYLGSDRAEDGVMDVFEHLHKKLPGQEIGNFRNWLQSVVRNHCLMQLRKGKHDPLQNSEALLMQSESFEHLLEEENKMPDQSAALARCLAALPDAQRDCIKRFYLQEGNTYKSIAQQLQLEVGRVRSYIQNGRRNLRLCLEKKQAS